MSDSEGAFYIPDVEFLFTVDVRAVARVLECKRPTDEVPDPYPWTDLDLVGTHLDELLPTTDWKKIPGLSGIYVWSGEIHFPDEEGSSDYRTKEIRPATPADLKRFGVVFGA